MLLVRWLAITLEIIRSSGSGRSSSAVNFFGYTDHKPSLRWRLPKIIFIFNRYVATSLILCVTCNTLNRKYKNNILD